MSSVFEQLAGLLSITILESEMSALVKIDADKDIGSISYEDVLLLLKNKGILYGIDEELLKNICAKPNYYLGKEVEIAKGLQPTTGEDAYLNWEISLNNEKKLQELEDGSVDFYSIKEIANVRKGQIILTKVPFTEGESGISVTNRKIAGKHGRDILIKVGKNVVLNENKDRLYSALDGQLVITDNDKINVFPIYEVNGDVDLSIGNINFVGSVIIRGNVPDGFKIHADGDIKVYGNVEGAELIAKGDIFIQQGIIGHNKSLIKAGGNVQAAFILDGEVYADKDILVTQSIMHSKLYAGKQVICKGVKGLVIGGNIQAGELIVATTIGNYMATATVVEVGMNPTAKRDWHEIQKNKRDLEKSLEKINQGLNILNLMQKAEGNLPTDKKRVQLDLINQQLVIEKQLKGLRIKEKEIEEELSHFEQASIHVLKMIYPGVRITIGKSIKSINKETPFVKFVIEDGDIVTKRL